MTTLVSGHDDPIAVAADSSHIYWANYSGTINAAPLAGDTATTLVTGQKLPDGVAAYGSRLYWANLGAGTIDEANLNGTGVTTLVTGQGGPVGVAVSPSSAPARVRGFPQPPLFGNSLTAITKGARPCHQPPQHPSPVGAPACCPARPALPRITRPTKDGRQRCAP